MDKLNQRYKERFHKFKQKFDLKMKHYGMIL